MLTKRTDLAMEAAAGLRAAGGHPGVWSHEAVEEGVELTVVEIRTPDAAQRMGKPLGRYVTLGLGPVHRREREAFQRSCTLLAREISKMLPQGDGPVLVVCLGNRNVTPDNLGPLVHDQLLVTRHLIREMPKHFAAFRSVAALAPGVLAATGVESGALTRAVVESIGPSCVIAVDALAAQGLERLCATVQLTDTGIAPGSGVGNCRQALSRETLGVPVIALGVPTVVDAATLCADLLEEAGRGEMDPQTLRGRGGGLFVTPRDIDQKVAQCAKLVAGAINLALQPGLDLEDLETLVE